MAYTPMGGFPTINVLFCNHIGGSTITFSMGLHDCRLFDVKLVQVLYTCWCLTNRNILVYKLVGGSPITVSKPLHT